MALQDKSTLRRGAGAIVYQFRIELVDIRPPVWRRVLVPAQMRLSKLHSVIQVVFGWTDTHLHRFSIAGQRFGQQNDFDEKVLDEAEVTLSEVVGTHVQQFSYSYDFGNDWVHEIAVEKIIQEEAGRDRPVCVAGQRHCPPEDCGGARGYAAFLKVISNPAHREHKEMLEWVGGAFDPEEFEISTVTRALAGLRTRQARV